MNFLKNLLGGIWLLFIANRYFELHSYYTSNLDLGWTFIGLLIGVLGVFALFGGLQLLRTKKSFSLTPFKGVGIFIGSVVMVGTLLMAALQPAVFNQPYQLVFYGDGQIAMIEEGAELTEGVEPAFTRGTVLLNHKEGLSIFPSTIQELFITQPLWETGKNLVLSTGMMMGLWAALILLFYGLGSLILKDEKGERLYESLGVGMGVVMGVMFLLGAAGVLTSTVVRVVIGGLFLLAFLRSKQLVQLFFNRKTTLNLEEIKTALPLGLVILILSVLNFINTIRPVPLGNDSLNVYHNTTHLLVEYGGLVKGLAAYNAELILSLGQFLFGSTQAALQITFLGGLMAFGLLYDTFKKYMKWSHALLLLAVFMSLPMVNFFMHLDLKIDLILLFFNILAIRSVIEWNFNKGTKKGWNALVLGGVFLGLSFGIKYTALLLIATILAYVAKAMMGSGGAWTILFLAIAALGIGNRMPPLEVYGETVKSYVVMGSLGLGFLAMMITLVKQKIFTKNGWSKMKPILVLAGMIVLTFSPWMIKNGLEIKSLDSFLLSGDRQEIAFKDFAEEGAVCTIANEFDYDLGTYLGSTPGVMQFVDPLWLTTINPVRFNDRITDISFLFLGFAAFVALGWREAKKGAKNKKYLSSISLFTMMYLALWLISANGVIWYGIPLFLGLLIIYGELWQTEKWTYGVLALWLVGSVFFRFTDTYINHTTLLHAAGLIDDSFYTQQQFEGYESMALLVNSEENINKNVYVTGGSLKYFLEQDDHRYYKDRTLDDFNCAFGFSGDETMDRLIEENFGFILYSEEGLFAEEDLEGPLHQQFEQFKNFAEMYLVEEIKTSEVTLYSIPE
jgi:hypothetical protein